MQSNEKADLLIAARKTASIYVTKESPGANDTPERILFEASQSAKEMLAAYAVKMANYDTIPLDIEGQAMRFYRSQWTIFSGYTGSGKTTALRQMVCHLLKAGRTVFVATLEQDPEDYLIELASTAAGVENPNESQLQAFLDAYGSQIKIWGLIGLADHRKILATIRSLAAEGLDYAIIDSLMCLDIPADDIEAQRGFAALLAATVHATKVHIILVAHPKKRMSGDQEPSTDDVAGSSNLGNLAYNVMFVRRGPKVPGQETIGAMEWHILKRRTKGNLGVINGFFYREQNQFHLDSYQQIPVFYLPPQNYPAAGLNEDVPFAEHVMNPNSFRVQEDDGPRVPPWELG